MPSGSLRPPKNLRYSDGNLNHLGGAENRLENILEETPGELGSSDSVPLDPFSDGLKTYNNDEDLRMSEERLLAKLQNGDDDDEDLTEVVMSKIPLTHHQVNKSSPLRPSSGQKAGGSGSGTTNIYL